MPGTIVQDDPSRDTELDGPADGAAASATDTQVDPPGSEGPGSAPARSTMPDIDPEPPRATLPDLEAFPAPPEAAEADDGSGEEGATDDAASAPKEVKRRSWVYFGIGAVFFTALAGPLVFYFFVWRYRPTAPQHIPSGTSIAVRIDGRELYLYEPFREHVIGAVDGAEGAAGRLARIKKHTGVDLRNDIREVIFATMTTDSWVVLIGGNFDAGRGQRGKFVTGMKTFLDEEGVAGYAVEDGVLKGPELRIAQAEDTTIILANNDEILRAATEPSDSWTALGLTSSGAVSFVFDRAAFEGVSKNTQERLPFLLLASPDTVEHMASASRGTRKMTGHLDIGRGPKVLIDIVPTTDSNPSDLAERWQLVQSDAKAMSELITSVDSGGFGEAMLEAKVKPRAETVMVTVPWDRKELDAGLERLGAKIRETLGD